MRRLRFYATLAILGTGIAMAMQYFDPRPAAPPEMFVTDEDHRAGSVTRIAPSTAQAPAAVQASPAPLTVIAPNGPLFRAAPSSGPIDTGTLPQIGIPVRHEAPIPAAVPQEAGRAGEANLLPKPAVGGQPGPAEIADDMIGDQPESAVPKAPAVRTKPRQQRAQARPETRSKRVESLFLNPLGVR